MRNEFYCHGYALTAGPADLDQRSDLYDSGAAHHMTPYRDEFTSFQKMPTRRFSCQLRPTHC